MCATRRPILGPGRSFLRRARILMSMMGRVLLLACVGGLSECASLPELTPAGAAVRTAESTRVPGGCDPLGPVTAQAGGGGLTRNIAVGELIVRNKAGARGATLVLLEPPTPAPDTEVLARETEPTPWTSAKDRQESERRASSRSDPPTLEGGVAPRMYLARHSLGTCGSNCVIITGMSYRCRTP